MPNYGIIDCGSNTVRLCIYEVDKAGSGSYSKKHFNVLLNHKIMAGLASYVEDGVMSDRGIKKAASAIRGHIGTAAFFNCKRLDVTATAFLRNCTNSKQAKKAIEQAIGVNINLLSAYDEAHLGFVGARCSNPEMTEGTLIDIGGGSTELTRFDEKGDSDNTSIPQGSLSSFHDFVGGLLPGGKECDTISKEFMHTLQREPNYSNYRNEHFYGIGGSVRALAKVYAELFDLPKKPTTLTSDQITEMLRIYRKNPAGFSHSTLSVTPDRVHTFIPGALITATLLDSFGAKDISICKYGLREGYLIDRILTDE